MKKKQKTNRKNNNGSKTIILADQSGATEGDSVSKYIFNLNYRQGKADRTMYREPVIHQALSCLIGKSKPNVLLIGAAGVGKAAHP